MPLYGTSMGFLNRGMVPTGHSYQRRRTSPVVAFISALTIFFFGTVSLGVPASAHRLAAAVPSTAQAATAQATTPKGAVAKAVTTKKRTIKKRTIKKRPTTTVKSKKKPAKKPTTTKKRTVSTQTLPSIAPTSPATSMPASAPPAVVAPSPDQSLPDQSSTLQPVAVGTTVALPTTTTRPGPTTTLPAAPFPAPANPPTRATAATIDPYRGLGTWVDRFDWTVRWGGARPAVNAATVDIMAAQGIQTIYIQAGHWSTSPDVLEPERLIPIIDRAHQLGMYVVVWYLPFLQDVNTDLRKTVALANLDVDGINIDIEERTGIANLAERNSRLIQYSQALRQLLPGRAIGNDIVATTLLDGAPNFWPQLNGQPKTNPQWWGGPFPYKEIAPYYDLWMIQAYWTDRAIDSGWRDGYRYTIDNMNRLRANLGRNDVPIQIIGGVQGSRMTLNDFSGFVQAAKDAGSVGVSLYDWVVTKYEWLPYLWSFRWVAPGVVPDPRFPLVPPPPYVEQPRPAPTTTIMPPSTNAAPSSALAPVVSLPTTTLLPNVTLLPI